MPVYIRLSTGIKKRYRALVWSLRIIIRLGRHVGALVVRSAIE